MGREKQERKLAFVGHYRKERREHYQRVLWERLSRKFAAPEGGPEIAGAPLKEGEVAPASNDPPWKPRLGILPSSLTLPSEPAGPGADEEDPAGARDHAPAGEADALTDAPTQSTLEAPAAPLGSEPVDGAESTSPNWMGLDLGEHSGLASMHPDGAASAGSGAAPSEPSTPLENIDSVVHDYVASMDNGARPELCDGVSPHAESFRRLLDSSATSTGQILGPPVLFGASPPMAIESILGLLGSLRETGVLHVEADGVTFTISIVKGDVVHGVSRPRPSSELLGNILVSMGTIDAAQLSRFLEEHGSSASTIGQALDNEWLVSTEELGRALEQQLRMLFSRLLATRQTVWCFRAGEATLAYINMRLNVIGILLESARTNDEQSTA